MYDKAKKIIDLSVPLESNVESETWPPDIEYRNHREGAITREVSFQEKGYDINRREFPDGIHMAWEVIETMTHTGTHMDAPWHYGPTVAGCPAKTIDEIPLDWCYGEAVILDFTWKEPGAEITAAEIEAAERNLSHYLTPGEILIIETGASQYWGTEEYLTNYPGLSGDAIHYAVDKGIRVIGTDAWGMDKPPFEMAKRYSDTTDSSELWPAHVAGRESEYCQIEKLANLEKLPDRTGVDFMAFPINIKGASAGWVRPVAFIEEESG